MAGDLLLIATGNTASNTNTLTLLLPVVIGGAIGIAGSLVTTLVAHPLQVRRERVAHTTSLQDAKRERLRAIYAEVLLALLNYQREIHQSISVIGNSRNDQVKVDQLFESLRLSIGSLQKSRVALILEENSDSVVCKSLEQLISSFANYVAGLRHDISDPVSYSATKRGEQEGQIDHEIEQFSTLLWSRLK